MFSVSRPVWVKGRSKEVNLYLVFDIPLTKGACTVRMTAATAYHLYADDRFIAYGPARAGEGYARIDEWDIRNSKRLRVLVAGYYSYSFQYSLDPSFLNLEVLDKSGNVLVATGRDKIQCCEFTPWLRYTDRHARQRVYTEVRDYTRAPGAPLETEVVPGPKYLPRRVAPFSNTVYEAAAAVRDFTIQHLNIAPESILKNGMSPYNDGITALAPGLGKRFENEECCLYSEIHQLGFQPSPGADDGAVIKGDTARLYDFSVNRAALCGLDAETDRQTVVYMIFDEILTDGDVVPDRGCLNVVKYILPAGEHHLLTFEPYCFRYVKVCVTAGQLTVRRLYAIEQAGVQALPVSFADPQLQQIYAAAVNTFRQNSTDIFMDCPSRERAGWLCDSFFTARSEFALTGKNDVETSFLENFAYHAPFRIPEAAPKGMVPMLYPGTSSYLSPRDWIPNWALWLIIEIGEYARLRHGDPRLIADLKDTVYGVLDSLTPFENEFGLLEDVPGWVFVEWSRANEPDVVCGVSFPSNLVYSGALKAAGETYGDKALIEKSRTLINTVREKSYNGRLFVDNSIRMNGELAQTDNTTEACQYYALFFGAITEELYPELYRLIIEELGPDRKQCNKHPDIPFANAFIGNYLRLDALMNCGRYEQVLKEIRDYFGYMAERTGTLWENVTPYASCCHGFASHTAVWLLRLKKELKLD